jgi:CRISPR-associated protein Cas1
MNAEAALITSQIKPRNGVVILCGYGIAVRVDRGHLIFEDGIGANRSVAKLPRVGHGLRRLVVIGADGMVSLAALRWLADQKAAFVMLDRDGSVLATTGPVRPSDARLRRAQALAHQSGAALRIARELIEHKLAGQEQVARDKLSNSAVADEIARCRVGLTGAEAVEAVRGLEAQGSAAYWSAWKGFCVNFPNRDLPRVPDHWRTFNTRSSPLTGSPRLAADPVNAILNYLYAVLESESRLAASALGLDPGLGFLHYDSRTRDSLASDLMEPVRPQVDSYVLDWVMREPLSREWFFEQRSGNCRLMASLAVGLAETASIWGHAVAPFAEWIARTLWLSKSGSNGAVAPATRLTQSRKRQVKGGTLVPVQTAPRQPSICRECGVPITRGKRFCGHCAAKKSKEHMTRIARIGRTLSHTPETKVRRAQALGRHANARQGWTASSLPSWLDNEAYLQKIQPALAGITCTAIASALEVSVPYAASIRSGRRIPHPKHWEKLAGLPKF